MIEAGIILTGGSVAAMDSQFTLYDPGAVVVTGGEIVAVGAADEIAQHYTARDVVDCSGCAVIPGFVNGHTHAPMVLLRGLADDLRLDVWLMGYIMPVEREFVNPEFCWLGTQLACAEMIRSGITCFGDMYYYEEAIADAAVQVGMRAVCAQSILKFPTPDAMSYEDGLHLAQDFVARWKGHHLVTPAIGPHAVYTATPEMIAECSRLATHYDVPIHIHLAETAQEEAQHRAEYGISTVPWLEEQGLFEARVSAMHCVYLDDTGMYTLSRYGVGVIHNPSSNLKLASGFAPVSKMLASGLAVGIGTDGPASNNDLDMLEEIRLTALLAKGVTLDPTAVPARQALAMATILGARALHLDHLIGSLEPGKRADITVLNLDDIHTTPRFQRDQNALYSVIVYAAHRSDVRHVLCDGVWLLRDGKLLTVDVDTLRVRANELARRVDRFLIAREESVLSKLLAIGGVAQEKTFEVQVKIRLPDLTMAEQILSDDRVRVVRSSRRRQYDTYFLFDDPEGSRLRYREDEVLDDRGEVVDVSYRLTLTGLAKEREFAHSILLSRSRFDAPAKHTPRFYREYFRPASECEVHKERRRYHIRFGGTDFALNFDRLTKPQGLGTFLEIKSRTWSAQDAEHKAMLIGQLIQLIGTEGSELVCREYLDLALAAQSSL